MNCERIQECFIDYQSGTLPTADAAQIRNHLKSCLTCQREWSGLQETLLKLDRLPTPVPSGRMAAQFYAWLEEEQRTADAPNPFAIARSRLDALIASWLPARPLFQAAAGLALLLGGIWAGSHLLNEQPSPQPTPSAAEARLLAEVSDLRNRVDSMGQFVAYSLQQQQSGNRRLQGVLTTLDRSETNDRVLAELLNTLAFDPSTNVRLCALEALYPHVGRDEVRAGVLAALPREASPLVQVAMIDFVAAARDHAAAPALEELTRSLSIDKAVRDAARRALVQL
ncbi:MAG: zf-HC2 domain-containing protein [Opitutaceae bacterium]|nr:zf-HC2 domain-containing protein [Opitutaceae bacterium]